MDVHCSTCGEPWDTCHLWHDAIFETSLSAEEAEAWRSLPGDRKLSDPYRRLFKEAGWEFGRSVINVIRCPECPEGAKPDADRLHSKALIEEILGDDEDGLASAFDQYRL